MVLVCLNGFESGLREPGDERQERGKGGAAGIRKVRIGGGTGECRGVTG